MSSLSLSQILSDARRLSHRLREDESSADVLIRSAQDVLKEVEALKQYQEDVEALNAIAHNRPRAQLVLGIQQENRHIRLLQQENKELRAALEEQQNALELIMSKYRQHMALLINNTSLDTNLIRQQNSMLLQSRTDKICEMANVMQKSIQLDDARAVDEQETLARLITENKGLRELLEISRRNGTLRDPIVGPRLVSSECQTEGAVQSAAGDLPPGSVDAPAGDRLREAAVGRSPEGTQQRHCDTRSADGSEKRPASMSLHTHQVPYGNANSEYTDGGEEGDDELSLSSPLAELAHLASQMPRALTTTSAISVHTNCLEGDGAGSAGRPHLSSESESASEDDEVIFNTIKRQVKSPRTPGARTESSQVNNQFKSPSHLNQDGSTVNTNGTETKVNGLGSHNGQDSENSNGHGAVDGDDADHPSINSCAISEKSYLKGVTDALGAQIESAAAAADI